MRVTHPKTLTWREVRPASHRFQPNVDHVAGTAWRYVPTVGGTQFGWEFDVSRALERKYGKWAVGWCWGVGEASIGGGPVAGWCCPEHSYTTHDETARRCAASLIEWRTWLEELAELFKNLKPASAEAVGPAATSVIMHVAARTKAQDIWHVHAIQVVGWFLEACGVDTKASVQIATSVLDDKLEKWTEPDDELLEEIDREFAKAATRALKVE